MNNKMIKGSVAGATGIVLLMGGFGTYALWSDSSDLSGTIASGNLDLTLGEESWHDVSTGTEDPPTWDADPTDGTDLMVPGDKVRLTQPFTVAATGKNLEFDVSVEGLPTGTWENLDVTMQLDGEPVAASPSITDHHFTVATNDDVNGQHTLEVFFDFDVATGNPGFAGNDVGTGVDPGRTDHGESVDVSAITVSIQQHRPDNHPTPGA